MDKCCENSAQLSKNLNIVINFVQVFFATQSRFVKRVASLLLCPQKGDREIIKCDNSVTHYTTKLTFSASDTINYTLQLNSSVPDHFTLSQIFIWQMFILKNVA